MQQSNVVTPCRTGYTRVIVEKPFGKDSDSFRKLSADLYQHLTEDQMYRIDHYLGKELIENLTVSFSLSIESCCLSFSGTTCHATHTLPGGVGRYAVGQAVSLQACHIDSTGAECNWVSASLGWDCDCERA